MSTTRSKRTGAQFSPSPISSPLKKRPKTEQDEDTGDEVNNSEKYKKYRVKQKMKVQNMQDSLQKYEVENEQLKDREQKLLYLLVLATRTISSKDADVERLRQERDYLRARLEEERRLTALTHDFVVFLRQVAKEISLDSASAVSTAAAVLATVKDSIPTPGLPPPQPSISLNALHPDPNLSLPRQGSGLGDSSNRQEQSFSRSNSATLSKALSFSAFNALPNFADEFFEKLLPADKLEEYRDSLLDSWVNAETSAAAALRNESINRLYSMEQSKKQSTSEPAESEIAKAGFFASYFNTLKRSATGSILETLSQDKSFDATQ